MTALRLLCSLLILLTLAACAKSAGGTSAGRTATKDGIPVISWEDAGQHEGKEVYVEGTVVAVKNTDGPAFINFHSDYRNTFTVFIGRNNKEAFGDLNAFLTKIEGKKIHVRGTIEHFKDENQDKPEIVATSPDQITIL